MQNPTGLRSADRSRGMSLLELLLVMAVLSTVVALSWPALRRPMNRSYVQNAAQQLQKDLLNNRLEAMETGRPRFFQFRGGTSEYHIGTRVLENGGSSDLRNASGEDEEGLLTGSALTADVAENRDSISLELPVGTTFVLPNLAEMPSQRNLAKAETDNASPSQFLDSSNSVGNQTPNTPANMMAGLAEGDWSLPIRFYPSGRMESGTISLDSEDGYQIVVRIEGLAGRVKISPIERRGDQDVDIVAEDQ